MTRLKSSALLILASVMTASAATPALPVKLTKSAADAAIKDIQKDRVDTENWLKSEPTSYLATIDRRYFLDRKTLTVGRAPDNDVRIDDPAVSAHHLRVTVEDDRFRVAAVDVGATFKVKDEAKREAILDPSYIGLDRFTLRLSHQRYPGIIVFDPKSPRFKEYKGLKYFPIDLAYRYELALTPNPKPETIIIQSTRGNQRRAIRVGWFDFTVGKTPLRLEAVRLLEPGVDESSVAILFQDATTGKETYPVGRYLDPKKLPSGKYLLDFNYAYNPACAYSDHYNCPIPSKANQLSAAIRAGEMDAHYH